MWGIIYHIQHTVKQMGGGVKEFSWKLVTKGLLCLSLDFLRHRILRAHCRVWEPWRFVWLSFCSFFLYFMLPEVLFLFGLVQSCSYHRASGSDKTFSISVVCASFRKEGLPGYWLIWEFMGFHSNCCIFYWPFSPHLRFLTIDIELGFWLWGQMLYMTNQCSFHNNPLRSGYDYIHLMDKETELKKIHMPFSKTYGRKIAKLG